MLPDNVADADMPFILYKFLSVTESGNRMVAKSENSGKAPDENADAWDALPAPTDDVRLTADSSHQGLGLR